MIVRIDYGTGWIDITEYVEKTTLLRTLKLHNNLKPTINTLKLKVLKSASLINSIMGANTVYIRLLEDDGVTFYFDGKVNRNVKIKVSHRIDGLALECTDMSWTFKEELPSSIFWENHKVMDSANTSNSIVHKLIALTGFDPSLISVQSIDKTVEYFKAAAGEKVEDILKSLLGEYGYIYNVEIDGSFKVYPFVQTTMITSGILDNSNLIGEISIKKIEAKAKSVTVNYRPMIHESDRIVASDTTGGTTVYKSNIQVAPNGYYPPGSNTKDIKLEYKYGDFELIRVANASLDLEGQEGIQSYRFEKYDLHAIVSIRNSNSVQLRHIHKLDIRGDVYYLGDYNSQYVHNGEATENTEEIDTQYIGNDVDAATLAQYRASYWKYADHSYVVMSKELKPLGAFITLMDTTLGLSTSCQITEIKDAGDGYYNYVLIGASSYEVIPTAGGEQTATTPTPIQDIPASDVLQDVANGYDFEEGGVLISSTTPLKPVLSFVRVPGGVRLISDKQTNLRYLHHYEFQVSEDGVHWYALGMAGDWKEGASGGATNYPNESIIHANIPPERLKVKCDTALNSNLVIVPGGTAQLSPGDDVEGDGIPFGTKIDLVASSTQIKLSANATAAGNGIPLSIGGTSSDTSKYMGRILLYRCCRVTNTGAISDWSEPITAQAGQVRAGDIPANTIMANQIVSNFLETGFANVAYSVTIGYVGSGTVENPQEGDRRIYLDEDEIIFQEYTGGKWSNQNTLSLGGADAYGRFNSIISAMGFSHPANDLINTEFSPGGEIWDMETISSGKPVSQNGIQLEGYLDPANLIISPIAKFGNNGLGATENGANVFSFDPYFDFDFRSNATFGFWFRNETTLDPKDTYIQVISLVRGETPSNKSARFSILHNANRQLIARFFTLNYTEDGNFQTAPVTYNLDEWNYVFATFRISEGSAIMTINCNGNEESVAFPIPTIAQTLTSEIFFFLHFEQENWNTNKHIIDDLLVDVGTDIPHEILSYHGRRETPWNSYFSSDDVIIKPKPGGRVVADGGLRVHGPLTAPNPVDPNDIITVSGPRGDIGPQGELGPQGPQGEPGFQTVKYDPAYSYVEDETVIRAGVTYCSMIDNNLGKDPSLDDGTNWVPIYFDSVPIGTVVATTFNSIPNGYLKFDGSIVLIADYPELYAAYGTKNGGDGISTFGLPNAQGLSLAGHGTSIVNGVMKGDGTLELLDIKENSPGLPVTTETTDIHDPQLLIHYMVKARHTTIQEQRDPNIDQRLVDVENTLTPAYQIYKTDYIDLSSGKNARALVLSHNFYLGREDLDIDVIWKRSSDGLIMSSGDNTYSGQSGFSIYELNNLQLKFKHSNNNNSGIYYDIDTGVAHWNDLGTSGFDLVKIVIKPKQVTGLVGEKGEPGVSTTPGPTGPQGDPGISVPNISGLTEIVCLDPTKDELIIFDEDSSSHKKIKAKNLRGNYVTDIIGHNLYRQFILKLADGTFRFNCGSSCAQNMIGGNGRSDKVIHNQRWPLLYEEGVIGRTIKQIDARGWMAAVLYDNGDLYTIGYNGRGQLGVGDNTNRYVFTKSAENVKRFWLSRYQGYHGDYTQTYLEKNDGTIWSTGHNGQGQLGIGTTTNQNSWQHVSFFDDKEVIEMYPSGCYHAYVLATTTDGKIWFTGYNGYGQCGDGGTSNHLSFTDISTYWGGLTTGPAGNIITHVGGHGYYTSGWNGQSWMGMLREDGLVRMCGDNDWGQLGNDGTSDIHSPHIVDIKYPGTQVTANIVQFCSVGDGVGSLYARDDQNNLYRWGYNAHGQLGDGTTTVRTLPYCSSDPEDIDHHCEDILIHDSNSYTYGHYANQFIKDDRDNSIWGVGYNAEYRVPTGQGNGNAITTFTRLAFDKDVNIIKARQLGETTTSRFTIFLDDEGRAWFAGSNTSYQLNYYATSPTVPMEIEVK